MKSISKPATNSTRRRCKVLLDTGVSTRSPILDIDHVNVGAYIRNTLAVDKNENRQDALFDIYRVMRPGEPPTIELGRSHVQVAVLRQRAL